MESLLESGVRWKAVGLGWVWAVLQLVGLKI